MANFVTPNRNVILAFRIKATAPNGKAPHNRYNQLPPLSVVNAHEAVCLNKGSVAFGTNAPLNENRWGNISQMILFANSCGQQFCYLCDVVDILYNTTPQQFPVATYGDIEAAQWKGVPYKTFFILKNITPLNQTALKNYHLISNPSITFDQQWLKPRFRIAYLF